MRECSKIALITGGLQFGGSTTFLLNLAAGFRSLGVSCAAFSLTHTNPFASEFAAFGLPVWLSDEKRDIFEDRLTAIYREVAKFRPHATIANIGADAYEVLRYVPRGVTRIGMIHDFEMAPRRLASLYQETLDGVVVVNRHLVDEVKTSAPELPCRYLAHGIALREGSFIRDANPDGPLKIIFFGRLVEGKGTRLFPKITEELHRRRIPFRWTMHGRGPDEDYLRAQLASEISSGEVIISPELPREELLPLVRGHDVFIMASEIEGGPLTLLEAMSLGLVPICNDIPCMVQEVVNPYNGFCIARDPVRYAETLAALHGDRALLERMSIAARKTISSHYSNKAMANRYLDFVSSLASRSAPVFWPKKIKLRPIQGCSPLFRLTQCLAITRQARRVLKRIRY